ncbi:MAG: hypothetical protein HS130_02125 [Deltaproteobacteria bacterium]|nr:hypothetical protein [Deltaproteobacteria bacterium]
MMKNARKSAASRRYSSRGGHTGRHLPRGRDKPISLTSGTCTRSSSELIDSPYLKSILKGFRDEFDYVFVDTPPILPLADMNIISRIVDGTILVVRAGATPKKVVLKAAQSLSEGRFIGIVLNGADTALASYYY